MHLNSDPALFHVQKQFALSSGYNKSNRKNSLSHYWGEKNTHSLLPWMGIPKWVFLKLLLKVSGLATV